MTPNIQRALDLTQQKIVSVKPENNAHKIRTAKIPNYVPRRDWGDDLTECNPKDYATSNKK